MRVWSSGIRDVVLAVLVVAAVGSARGGAYEPGVKLLPAVCVEGTNWATAAAWNWDGKCGAGPVWWSEDSFDVFPLFWSRDEEWLLFPLAWNLDASTGIGPIWWGDTRFGIFPLLWTWSDGWTVLPLMWSTTHGNGVGPVLWGEGYFGVLPFCWSRDGDWMVLPAGWNWKGSKGVGPVSWGDGYFDILPFFWSRGCDWMLPPLAWNWRANHGVGPVWWGEDYLDVFPLYFRHGNKSVIPPVLGWSRTDGKGGREFIGLARLFRWASDPDGYNLEVQPIIDVAGGEVGHFSLFWRLLEYHRDQQERYWRFLYLPFKFGHRNAGEP